MQFLEKIKQKQADLHGVRQPVIAFLGDSVTHGCFDVYVQDNTVQGSTEMEKGYHEKIKEIFRMLYPTVPVTMVNAGIGGDYAKNGKARLQRDVLSFAPDLVVVCYGLNDACFGDAMLPDYIASLKEIFDRAKEAGAEVIFLTPNLRTERVDIRFSEDLLNKCAEGVANNEKEGVMDRFLDAARTLCQEEKVPVCDCHRIWKRLKENDVDINFLLSNRINHPIEKMHWLFAYELVRTIFDA